MGWRDGLARVCVLQVVEDGVFLGAAGSISGGRVEQVVGSRVSTAAGNLPFSSRRPAGRDDVGDDGRMELDLDGRAVATVASAGRPAPQQIRQRARTVELEEPMWSGWGGHLADVVAVLRLRRLRMLVRRPDGGRSGRPARAAASALAGAQSVRVGGRRGQ